MKNKKGQGFISWFFIIAFLLAVSIFFLVMNKTWNDIEPELASALNGSVNNAADQQLIGNVLRQTGDTNRFYDRLMPFLLIGLFGFVLISAGAIMKHPIMIFVGLIIMGVVVTLALIFSNIYGEISESSSFADTSDDLPIQQLFIKYLPLLAAIGAIGVGILIVMARGGGSGGQL